MFVMFSSPVNGLWAYFVVRGEVQLVETELKSPHGSMTFISVPFKSSRKSFLPSSFVSRVPSCVHSCVAVFVSMCAHVSCMFCQGRVHYTHQLRCMSLIAIRAP